MKRGLRKKGASLVAVLVICSIILVTATTMIGVATSDVRMRINESKRLQNMYLSDSGLEVVYNSILKNSEAAIEYAKSQITINNVGNTSDDELYDRINNDFKDSFIRFLWGTPVAEVTTFNSIPTTYKDSNIQIGTDPGRDANSRLLFSILNYKYISEVNNDVATYVDAFTDSSTRPEINVKSCKYDINTKTITLTVQSSFETKLATSSSTKLKNKKVIQTKFTIQAPEYAEILERTSERTTANVYPVYKAIAIDGNLKINNNTDISGDIWVKGNSSTARRDNPGIMFTKYDGGITLGNGVEFNTESYTTYDENGQVQQNESNIYTASTFSLSNNVNANLSGNLYSKNTYIGPVATGESSGGNELSLNNMTTYNDLAINSLSSTVSINSYYGINSKPNEDTSKTNASRNSSCILINNHNIDSRLSIGNAYIMGVAYINTNDGRGDDTDSGEYYATGESVAVKGNQAKVYTEVLPGYSDSVNLKYYSGVQLVESINGSSSTNAKKDYFNAYKSMYPLDDGGISINNIYSVGAFVNRVTTGTAQGIDEGNRTIDTERKSYGKNVLAMGSNITDSEALNYYNGSTEAKTVANLVDFGAILHDYPQGRVLESQNYYGSANNSLRNEWRIALSGDPSETIIIGEDSVDSNGNQIKVIRIVNSTGGTVSEFNINGINPNGNEVNAIILAEGNVIVNPGINFTGTIIAGGDVTLERGNQPTTITYNEEKVVEIATRNSLDGYFENRNITAALETITVSSGDNVNVISSNGYNTGDVVNKGLWSLIK